MCNLSYLVGTAIAIACGLYPIRVFGYEHYAALAIGAIAAVIYIMTSIGIKMLNTQEKWLDCLAKSHKTRVAIIRSMLVAVVALSIGVLVYFVSIDITTMEYSEWLWDSSRAFAGIVAGILVILPWLVAKT